MDDMSHGSYLDEALSRIGAVIDSPALVEIAINPDGRIWSLEHGDPAMKLETRAPMNQQKVMDLGRRIASAGTLTLGRDAPIISTSVVYRGRPIRAQVVAEPAVLSGAAISMRFFSSLPLDKIRVKYLHGQEYSVDQARAETKRELKKLAASGDIDAAMAFIVHHKMNALIAGATDSGKTVFARKMLSYVSDSERMITIEDAAELVPTQPNVVTLIADRDSKTRTPDILLTSCLRMRPDRLIVGEVRGKEAMTFIEAINTGHGGSMTTIHAETPKLALSKLAIMALKSELPLTYADTLRYIASSIDVVIQTGRAGGDRGVLEFYIPDAGDNGDTSHV